MIFLQLAFAALVILAFAPVAFALGLAFFAVLLALLWPFLVLTALFAVVWLLVPAASKGPLVYFFAGVLFLQGLLTVRKWRRSRARWSVRFARHRASEAPFSPDQLRAAEILRDFKQGKPVDIQELNWAETLMWENKNRAQT